MVGAFAYCGGTRIDAISRFESTAIPYKVVYSFDRALGPGRLLKVQNGKPGSITRILEMSRDEDGEFTNRRVLKEDVVQPVDAVFAMGRAGWSSTRGNFVRANVLTMKATGYSAYENTNWTALGLRAGYGIVAVDPNTIRLGSRVFVEGYGFAIAGDTGGAIKGNRIDLCFDSYSQAMRFGRKTVRVHVLG
jgi:3D (Asp-Asp-Asp) domain-containing protein